MKTNETLQRDVQNAIKWEPLLRAAEIGVTVRDGVVSLTGIVDSYVKKLEAETATKKVAGVKAVVEDIDVKFSSKWHRTNEEIAHVVISALKGNWLVPDDKIQVEVEDGWVTLSGTLPWHYQKVAAEDATKHHAGIKGVTNEIKIESEIEEAIEKEDIENALDRTWWINDTDISVDVDDHEVTLSGRVNSYYQREAAERIAWKTRGIWSVDNQLEIDWE